MKVHLHFQGNLALYFVQNRQRIVVSQERMPIYQKSPQKRPRSFKDFGKFEENDSFESELEKQLNFSQLYDLLKLYKDSNFLYRSSSCKICESCCLLIKRPNKQRNKLLQSFLQITTTFSEKFSCNPHRIGYVLDKCFYCKPVVYYGATSHIF